jgi:peroxiredoxin
VNRGQALILAAVALLGMAGGFLTFRHLDSGSAPASAPVADIVGAVRPDYTLGASDGRLVSPSEFDGSVVLVNFWATWCKPCIKEMPMLSDIQETMGQQGLQVVGIALDDVQRARDFAAEIGVEYPILVGSTDVMVVARNYGNLSGMLPYSVLIGRDGVVRWTHLGELVESELKSNIQALL